MSQFKLHTLKSYRRSLYLVKGYLLNVGSFVQVNVSDTPVTEHELKLCGRSPGPEDHVQIGGSQAVF